MARHTFPEPLKYTLFIKVLATLGESLPTWASAPRCALGL